MKQDERTVHQEVLERIEKSEDDWTAGNKMLVATINYKKEAYRNRPRGYYLCLSVYLETDQGSQVHCLSFGDEGDPSSQFLLEETKAFSQKKFDALVVDPALLATRVAQIKAEYETRKQKAEVRRQLAGVN